MTLFKPITVEPYTPLWAEAFKDESEKLKSLLNDMCLEIHHIGSTSVPGLAAKPFIDICCIIKDLSKSLTLLSHGYSAPKELNIPLRYYFSKKTQPIGFNVHVTEPDHGFLSLNLFFRDYLRTYEKTRRDYERLKLNLAQDIKNFECEDGIFPKYTLKKNTFIKQILQKSGYDGLNINFCLHVAEWTEAQRFRQAYCQKMSMTDPGIMKNEKNKHLIFYKGALVIGYAHIICHPERYATISVLSIDESIKNLETEEFFLQFCKKWLHHHGFQRIEIRTCLNGSV